MSSIELNHVNLLFLPNVIAEARLIFHKLSMTGLSQICLDDNWLGTCEMRKLTQISKETFRSCSME